MLIKPDNNNGRVEMYTSDVQLKAFKTPMLDQSKSQNQSKYIDELFYMRAN